MSSSVMALPLVGCISWMLAPATVIACWFTRSCPSQISTHPQTGTQHGCPQKMLKSETRKVVHWFLQVMNWIQPEALGWFCGYFHTVSIVWHEAVGAFLRWNNEAESRKPIFTCSTCSVAPEAVSSNSKLYKCGSWWFLGFLSCPKTMVFLVTWCSSWGAFLGDLCSDQALTCKISVEEYFYNSFSYIIVNDFIFQYISVTAKINFEGFPG